MRTSVRERKYRRESGFDTPMVSEDCVMNRRRSGLLYSLLVWTVLWIVLALATASSIGPVELLLWLVGVVILLALMLTWGRHATARRP